MMERRVCFMVPGPPTTWERPRARVQIGRPKHPGARPPTWIEWFTDEDVDQAERRVCSAFGQACNLQPFEAVPLSVSVLVIESRQKDRMRLTDPQGLIPSVSPRDVDNLAKLVLDGLQRCALCGGTTNRKAGCECAGGRSLAMVSNDRLVTHLDADKARAEIAHRAQKRSAEPRVYVSVSELDTDGWIAKLRELHPDAFSGRDLW